MESETLQELQMILQQVFFLFWGGGGEGLPKT